jgi:hypothetical protein
MQGTLQPQQLTAAPRRSAKTGIVTLVALAMLAGIVAGAALVYMAHNTDLMIFLGFTYPKDCG